MQSERLIQPFGAAMTFESGLKMARKRQLRQATVPDPEVRKNARRVMQQIIPRKGALGS